MSPENTQRLYDAFPRLYRGRHLPREASAMLWGFECGDGWFELIWNLSLAIEEQARQDRIDSQSDAWPEAIQVKSKFGSFRFHLRQHSESLLTLIEAAREAAQAISEISNAKPPKD